MSISKCSTFIQLDFIVYDNARKTANVCSKLKLFTYNNYNDIT